MTGNALRRCATALLLVAVTACGHASALHRIATSATLDSLPQFNLTDGTRVCFGTGYTLCPEHNAVANWVSDTSFAMWEPGRDAAIWQPRDTSGMALGRSGSGPGRYGYVIGVARHGSGYLLVDAAPSEVLQFDRNGRFVQATPIPAISNADTRGFLGPRAVLQRLVPHGPDRAAEFTVRLLRAPADSSGRIVLDVPVDWMRLDAAGNAVIPTAPIPFFPSLPVYTMDIDGDLFWSPGDHMALARVTLAGDTVWTISSDLRGPPITPGEIAAQRAALDSQAMPGDSGRAAIDSMAARTGSNHPALAALYVASDGRLLALAGSGASRDSTDAYVVSREGVLAARLRFGRRDRPLLFAGDSVLVFRPTAGEPWEVRWLRLTRAH